MPPISSTDRVQAELDCEHQQFRLVESAVL
jgi:hypothetical protein